MATIKDIIFSEFKNYGYEIIAERETVVIFKHQAFEDFWAVCLAGFNLSQQHDLYENTVKVIAEKFPYAPKNTSLLVLSDLTKESLATEQIVELEKDPFFFKKYFLPYSDDLTQKLLELLAVRQVGSVSDLIMLPESFTALNEENEYGVYHLLYSIAHKLPFVPIKAAQKGLQQKEFYFDTPDECAALDEVMEIEGDGQAVYDQLKRKIEEDANEQH